MAGTDYHTIARRIGPPPFGSAERADLKRFGHRAGLALGAAVRGGALSDLAKLGWADQRSRLLTFAGIDGDDHCLTTRGHEWLWPLERQATEGFAHFLCSGPAPVRRARALAFLRSLEPPVGRSWPERIDGVSVVAEQRIERGPSRNGRIDLMIVAAGEDGPFGAVVEAKFEHNLSGNPLAAYVTVAARHGLDGANCSYLVLGIRNDPTIRLRLARNQRWRFQSWRRLLMAHERLIAPRYDDEDYRRFRRTIAARAQ